MNSDGESLDKIVEERLQVRRLKADYKSLEGDFRSLITGLEDTNWEQRVNEAVDTLLVMYETARRIRGMEPLSVQQKDFYQISMNFVIDQYKLIPGNSNPFREDNRPWNKRLNNDYLIVHYLETAQGVVRFFTPPTVETISAAAGHDLEEDHRDVKAATRNLIDYSQNLKDFVDDAFENDMQKFAHGFQEMVSGLTDSKTLRVDKNDPVARKRSELNSLWKIYEHALKDTRVLQIKTIDRMLNLRDSKYLNDKRRLKMVHETLQGYLDTARPEYFPEPVFNEFWSHYEKSAVHLPGRAPQSRDDLASYMLNHIVTSGRELARRMEPEQREMFYEEINPDNQKGVDAINMEYAHIIYNLISNPDEEFSPEKMQEFTTPSSLQQKIKSKLTEWKFAKVFLYYEPTAQQYTELDSMPLERFA